MKLDTQTVLQTLAAIAPLNVGKSVLCEDYLAHAIAVAVELERQVETHNREQEPTPPEWKPNSGVERISMERARQILVAGWTVAHDDDHVGGELAAAARCYAFVGLNGACPELCEWPWPASGWKPSDDPIKNLVRAGALIAAEIDRLLRIEAKQPHLNPPTKWRPSTAPARAQAGVCHAPAEIADERMDCTELQRKYEELIFAVATCFPGETRHQTALRYIHETEAHCSDGPAVNATPHEGPLECPPPVGQGPHFKHGANC